MNQTYKVSEEQLIILQNLAKEWQQPVDHSNYYRQQLVNRILIELRTIFGVNHELFLSFKKLHEDFKSLDYTTRAWDIGGEEERHGATSVDIWLFIKNLMQNVHS